MVQVAVVAVVGTGLLLVGILQLRKSRGAAAWPSAAGTIQKAGIFSDPDLDSLSTSPLGVRVVYSFQVSGREFTGTRIRFDEVRYPSAKRAEQELAKFPAGGPVTVFFDPQDPARCVLQKNNRSGVVFLVLGAIFVIAAIAAAVSS